MEEQNQETNRPNDDSTSQVNGTAVQNVTAQENLSMNRSVALSASAGQDMQVSASATAGLVAGRDVTAANLGAFALVAGGNVTLTNGGSQLMVVGGDLHMSRGGAELVLASSDVTADHSFIGIAISQHTVLNEGSRVLLNTPQAIAFGAALGVAVGLMSWLLPKRPKHGKG